MSPKAAAHGNSLNTFYFFKFAHNEVRRLLGSVQEEFLRMFGMEGDSFENVFRGRFSKSLQLRDAAIDTGFLQAGKIGDAQGLVEQERFLRPQPLNAREL